MQRQIRKNARAGQPQATVLGTQHTRTGPTVSRLNVAPLIFARLLVTSLIILGLTDPTASAEAENHNRNHSENQTPSQPRSEEAAKAYLVFKNHCARCHQKGSPVSPPAASFKAGLLRAPAATGLDAILDLAALAKKPSLVRPGLPDSSPLYNAMLARHMPPHPSSPSNTDQGRNKRTADPDPSATELEAVRTWIASLERSPNRCTTRVWQTRQALREDIERYVATLTPTRAARTRFISLAHLSNDCATPRQLETYRSSLTRFFNRLSWQKSPTHLMPISDANLVLALDLGELGWPNARWDWLTSLPGSRIDLASGLNDQTRNSLHSTVPVVRADWLAHTAATPSAYASMLALPVSVSGLRAKLKNIYGPIEPTRLAAVKTSRLTSGPRLIARHGFGEKGFIWEAIEPDPRNSDAAKTSHLLRQPKTVLKMLYARHPHQEVSAKARRAYREVATRRFLFRLPNGSIGTMLTDRDGYRFDHAVRDTTSPLASSKASTRSEPGKSSGATPQVDTLTGNHTALAGTNCMSCHGGGVLHFTNAIGGPKSHPDRTRFKPGIAIKNFSTSAIAAAIANDNHEFTTAAKRARGDAQGGTSVVHPGNDPLRELARLYRSDLDLTQAAASAWMQQSQFLAVLESYNGPLTATARRLRQGTVTRSEFESLIAALDLAQTDAAVPQRSAYPSDSASLPAPKTTTRRISVWSDKPTYNTGDSLTIFAQPNHDCRLTVFALDIAGFATVLFPNSYARDNLVKSGHTISLPTKDAPYLLKLNSAGSETIIAQCTLPEVDTLPGIDHSFDAQQFTVLGNWTKHLKNTYELEAKTYKRGFVPNDLRRRIVRNGRRRRSARRPNWLLPKSAPFITNREAISILIQN